MNQEEFKQDLKINPLQLDVEAGLQGELFFKWAERSIEANKEKDEARLNRDLMQARLSTKARLDPDSMGINKPTEGAIAVAVSQHPDMEEAEREYIKARSNADTLQQAVSAMEQRKRMIEVLITLHGQQYFAGPSVPRNLAEAWKEANDKRETNIIEKQKTIVRKRKPVKEEEKQKPKKSIKTIRRRKKEK